MEKKLLSINPKKATGYDQLPPKLLKPAGKTLAPSMTALINHSIKTATFPSDLKYGEVSPHFKKDDMLDKTKYRPVSILPSPSKLFESIILDQVLEYFEAILDKRISAFRKKYSTQSVLLKAVEDWRKALDQGLYVGAILIDLSKAFDLILHGLLLAKLHMAVI